MSVCLSMFGLFVCPYICVSRCLCILCLNACVCPTVHLFVQSSVCMLSVCLSVCLGICLSVSPHVCPPNWNILSAALHYNHSKPNCHQCHIIISLSTCLNTRHTLCLCTAVSFSFPLSVLFFLNNNNLNINAIGYLSPASWDLTKTLRIRKIKHNNTPANNIPSGPIIAMLR